MNEISLDNSNANYLELRKRISARIRSDMKFCSFYLSPGLNSESFSFEQASIHFGYSPAEANLLKRDFLRSGLWRLDEQKQIHVVSDFLDLGEMTLSEHMISSLDMLSKMPEAKNTWYDFLAVVTTDQLKRELYREINRSLRNFVQKSSEVDGDRVLMWTHQSMDTLGFNWEPESGEKND